MTHLFIHKNLLHDIVSSVFQLNCNLQGNYSKSGLCELMYLTHFDHNSLHFSDSILVRQRNGKRLSYL